MTRCEPMPLAFVTALLTSSYEKRKLAALDLER